MAALSGLYALTRTHASREALLYAVSQALAGGARMVQYRDKGSDADTRLKDARALRELCQDAGRPLIINDDVALVQAAGAHGVHFSAGAFDIARVRRELGDGAIIGVSCHNNLHSALDAEGDGADYASFGSMYASTSKPTAVRAPLDLIVQAKATLKIPVCAIGGINPANAAPLIAAGADMIAAIAGIFDAPDVRAAAGRYAALFTD